jgi:hypothetical protein
MFASDETTFAQSARISHPKFLKGLSAPVPISRYVGQPANGIKSAPMGATSSVPEEARVKCPSAS